MGSQILLHEDGIDGSTLVPNNFLDNYMPNATGEYVKIYLYLLRCRNRHECSFSVASVADRFQCTEGDVRRGLLFWEKAGLLHLESNARGDVTGIYFLNPAVPSLADQGVSDLNHDLTALATLDALPQAADPAARTLPMEIPMYSKTQVARFTEENGELLYICGRYLGRYLSQADVNYLLFWQDKLGFNADLSEYLVEYSLTMGTNTFPKMNKTAEQWFANEIRDVEQAKIFSKTTRFTPLMEQVMEVFGITKQMFKAPELAFVRKWSRTWKMPEELILEACSRTITITREPSFDYADRILSNWHNNQVTTMEDVIALDDKFRTSHPPKSTSSRKSTTHTTPKKPAYTCAGRNYDNDALMRDLLQS